MVHRAFEGCRAVCLRTVGGRHARALLQSPGPARRGWPTDDGRWAMGTACCRSRVYLVCVGTAATRRRLSASERGWHFKPAAATPKQTADVEPAYRIEENSVERDLPAAMKPLVRNWAAHLRPTRCSGRERECGRRSCLRTTRCGMRWRAADRERFCPTRPPAAELRCGCAVDRCGCPLDGRLLRRSVRGSRANMDRQSWCLSPRYLVISCGQPQVGDTRLIAQCCGDRLTR
jgi:hypothetical protein